MNFLKSQTEKVSRFLMSGMWKLSLDVEIEPAVLKEISPLIVQSISQFRTNIQNLGTAVEKKMKITAIVTILVYFIPQNNGVGAFLTQKSGLCYVIWPLFGRVGHKVLSGGTSF